MLKSHKSSVGGVNKIDLEIYSEIKDNFEDRLI